MYPMKSKPNRSAIRVFLSWLPKMTVATSNDIRHQIQKVIRGKVEVEREWFELITAEISYFFKFYIKRVTDEHIPRSCPGPWEKQYKCVPLNLEHYSLHYESASAMEKV